MREFTAYLLIANLIFLCLYNVVARLTSGPEATISRVLGEACYRYPELMLLAGLIIGHILWPNRFPGQ